MEKIFFMTLSQHSNVKSVQGGAAVLLIDLNSMHKDI